jgi:hypothetical protein
VALKLAPAASVTGVMRIRVSAWFALGVAFAASALGRSAAATAGTHPLSVSTYDTRASSIVVGYKHGFSDAGSFNTFSYNANFTSTTGRLSAQFGIHYVNFKESTSDTRAHGVAGSGVGVLVFPVAGRYENGVPKAGLALHLGGVPTAYISGERNFLTLPFVIGFGVPLSPAKFLTFTPWYELAFSANVDTVVRPEGVTIGDEDVIVDPQNQTVSLREGAVQDALAQGVTIDVGVSVPMRVGLEASFHLGKTIDLNLYAALSSMGGAFSGDKVQTVGGAFVIRWDDIVPAVLPKQEPVTHESCEATERRFRACPISRTWLSPEQRGRAVPEAAAPATTAPAPGAVPPRGTGPVAPTTPPVPAAPTTPAPTAPPAPAPVPAPAVAPAEPAPAAPSGAGNFPPP